jgi:type VI secretion system secreted protein Hcp
MATDTHIKFDGVDGEATHKDHKGQIEVLSWAWGASNGTALSGGGSGKGKGEGQPFQFVHLYDKASPVLAKHCAQGKHFATVTVVARKAGEGQKDFFKITMKEVLINHIAPAGSQGGDITESVSMTYKDIEFSYKPQDDKGNLGGEVKFGWNLATTETR